MASSAIQWQLWQDEAQAGWIDEVQTALSGVETANSSQLQAALSNVSTASSSIPEVSAVTPADLRAWSPDDPSEWLARMDSGQNLSSRLGSLLGQLEVLTVGRDAGEVGQIMAVTGSLNGQLIPLTVLQNIDYRASILSLSLIHI